MGEIKKDNQVADKQRDEKNQTNSGTREKGNNQPEKPTTLIEDSQSEAQKEIEENEHQHSTQTPVGDKKVRNEKQTPDKSTRESL